MYDIRPLLKSKLARLTGRPQSLIIGDIGSRRTFHFYPDGSQEEHAGGHCCCEVNWLLSSLRTWDKK